MPRDGSGTYTFPVNSFNPAVNNTVIDPSDWNDTSADLATAVTDSLDRSGEGGMLANLDMGTHNVTNAGTYNKVTITAPAAGSTLTIADGKTLTVSHTATFTGGDGYTVSIAAGKTFTVSNSLTLTGTDSTSFAFPGTGTTVVGIDSAQTLTNKTIVGSSNTISAIALASLASQAAYSLTGNVTGSSASPTAFTIGGLTQKVSPAATDLVLIQDQAAAGQLKYALVSSVGSAGSVSSIAGNTGAFTLGTGLTNTVNDIELNISKVTNSLSGDVTLNNTSNYFDGPSCAQGTTGTWFASGTVTIQDNTGTATFFVKLWDGTTVIASGVTQTPAIGTATMASLSGYLASPAANIRISVRDTSSTTGKILFNTTGTSKDSTLTVLRIA